MVDDGLDQPRFTRVHRDIIHVLLLVAFDVFALYEAFILAYTVRASDPHPFAQAMSIGRFGELAAVLSPLWVAIFGANSLYAVGQRRSLANELGRITVAVSCGVMALIVLDYMRTAQPVFPGRSVPIYCLVFGIAFVFGCRIVVRLLLRIAYARGRACRNVVLIGSGSLARRITAELSTPRRGYRVVAVVDPKADGALLTGNIRVYPTLDAALRAVPRHVDEVVQADTDLDRAEVARLMSHATERGLSYRFVPDQYGVYAAASTMTSIGGIPVMEVRLTSLDRWGAVAKRASDVIGSLVLLTVAAPVLLVIAALVKVTDPAGPVFYRQERLGRRGELIRIIKFRTMRWEYSTGPGRPFASAVDAFAAMGRPDLVEEFDRTQKVLDDPRVSRFGRWLRKVSLDELPQLFDVLRGDLSLIGPRPITREELARYGTQRVSFLTLKPGITGLWQVSGRNDISYEERIKLDIFYIENWSLRLDMTILARTTGAVLARRGAY